MLPYCINNLTFHPSFIHPLGLHACTYIRPHLSSLFHHNSNQHLNPTSTATASKAEFIQKNILLWIAAGSDQDLAFRQNSIAESKFNLNWIHRLLDFNLATMLSLFYSHSEKSRNTFVKSRCVLYVGQNCKVSEHLNITVTWIMFCKAGKSWNWTSNSCYKSGSLKETTTCVSHI